MSREDTVDYKPFISNEGTDPLCMWQNGLQASEHILQIYILLRDVRAQTISQDKSVDGEVWRTQADNGIHGCYTYFCINGQPYETEHRTKRNLINGIKITDGNDCTQSL